jgi:hypothetical protein
MANTLLTRSEITREALWVLENNLVMAKHVNRQYSDEFANKDAKIGATINIRKPPRYKGRSGPTLSIEDSTETYLPLTVDQWEGCDLVFSDADLALNIDDFSERFIKPAIATVSNKIDRSLCSLYKKVANTVGVPGTAVSSLLPFLQAGAYLADEATPQDGDKAAIVDPWTEVDLVDSLKGLFHSSAEIEKQYKEGTMGLAGGYKFSMDQNIYRHTVGVQGGTPLYNGSLSYTASTIGSKGWTAAAAVRLNAGDMFTIENVYAVNPQTRESTGHLRNFVVSSDFSSDGSGNGSIKIGGDGIITSGPFQNVSAAPVDGARITVFPTTINGFTSTTGGTTTPMNLAFHKNAFALATVDLPLPKGVHYAERIVSKKLGISMRIVQAYDIVNSLFPLRIDILYGTCVLYPGFAARVTAK